MPGGPTRSIRDRREALEAGQHAFERGRMEEAISLLEQAVTLGTDTAATHTMLGVACARQHQVERAFEHLGRAVALEPGGFAPRCALGELYTRLCVPDKAREHLPLALDVATGPQERRYVH